MTYPFLSSRRYQSVTQRLPPLCRRPRVCFPTRRIPRTGDCALPKRVISCHGDAVFASRATRSFPFWVARHNSCSSFRKSLIASRRPHKQLLRRRLLFFLFFLLLLLHLSIIIISSITLVLLYLSLTKGLHSLYQQLLHLL